MKHKLTRLNLIVGTCVQCGLYISEQDLEKGGGRSWWEKVSMHLECYEEVNMKTYFITYLWANAHGRQMVGNAVKRCELKESNIQQIHDELREGLSPVDSTESVTTLTILGFTELDNE